MARETGRGAGKHESSGFRVASSELGRVLAEDSGLFGRAGPKDAKKQPDGCILGLCAHLDCAVTTKDTKEERFAIGLWPGDQGGRGGAGR